MRHDDMVHAAVEARRAWCEERRRAGEEGVFLAQARALPLPPSLNDALRVPRGARAVIAELVRRCPWGAGWRVDYSCAEMVGKLHAIGVSALSLPTNVEFWGVDYADILEAAQASSLPIICRDLVVDPLQVTMARAHGASAVQLCATLLDEGEFRRLFLHATDLGLDVVAEVRSVQDVEMVSRIRLGYADNGSVRIFCVSDTSIAGEDVPRQQASRLSSALPEFALRVADSEECLEALDALGYEACVMRVALPESGIRVEAFADVVGTPLPVV